MSGIRKGQTIRRLNPLSFGAAFLPIRRLMGRPGKMRLNPLSFGAAFDRKFMHMDELVEASQSPEFRGSV